MNSQLTIQYHLEKLGTSCGTVADLPFDGFDFLYAAEPVLDFKGQRVSKSYYDKKNKEAVRIIYKKIIDTYSFNGIDYPEQFIGVQKTIQFIDWSGEVGYSKEMQGYFFNLEPVFRGDGTETIISFSSAKQRQILKQERYSSDDMLNAKNPMIYAFLFEKYSTEYQYYLRTGIKDNLEASITSEKDATILEKLNHSVFGSDLTVKELILSCLQ